MGSPAISVVVPYRNSSLFFSRALESLSRQTFRDFEVVMVENCSTDDSSSIAKDYSASDPRFRSIACEGSLVDALNLGLSASRGRWIARFDSDDICHRNRLGMQLALAERLGERTVVSCRVRSFPSSLVSSGYRSYENWINSLVTDREIRGEIFVESPVPHPSAFFHRASVIGEGGYLESGMPEDYELWLRLWSRGFGFARVPRVLLGWREGRDRLSRVSPVYSLTSFYRLQARYLARSGILPAGRAFIAGTGQCARRLSGCLAREGVVIEGYISPLNDPGKRTIRGRPVIGAGDWEPVRGIPVLTASREHGSRESIREYLQGFGLENMKDYVLCS